MIGAIIGASFVMWTLLCTAIETHINTRIKKETCIFFTPNSLQDILHIHRIICWILAIIIRIINPIPTIILLILYGIGAIIND